jgi:hypothetical protein
MKYWEIIADRLHAEGWSYGIAAATSDRVIGVGCIWPSSRPRHVDLSDTVSGETRPIEGGLTVES